MSIKGLQLLKLGFQIRGLWSCLMPLGLRIFHHLHVHVPKEGETGIGVSDDGGIKLELVFPFPDKNMFSN